MSLKPLLRPKSIAIVGASPTLGKIGHEILKNLERFKGKVYPINPKHDSILGKKCYPCVAAIKKRVDLALFAVPAHIIPQALKAASNAKVVVIISSGFSEVDDHELASTVLEIAKRNKQRILGPNCLGVQIPYLNLNATFAPKMAKPGGIAFISQSGGFGSAMLDWMQQEYLGLSAFISIGNMLDLNFSDLLHYFSKDKHTTAIALYMEGLKDGRRFLAAAKKCKKPIVVLKIGKTEEGVKTASTHTGSLAGEQAIYSGAFRQAGIIEASSTAELFDIVKGFSLVKKPTNNKVVILTNSGGPGAAAADSISAPLELHGSVIDLTGGATADTFKQTLHELRNVKANFLVTYVPTEVANPCEIASLLADFARKKTVVASFLGGHLAYQCSAVFKSHCAAHFETPERAMNTLKKLVRG